MILNGMTITKVLDVKRNDLKLRFANLLKSHDLPYYEGWDPLIVSLLERAEVILKQCGIPTSEWPKSATHEKLGSLRMNFSYTRIEDVDQKLRVLTSEAFQQSRRICIFCGDHGYMRGFNKDTSEVEGWIHPACDRCEALSVKGEL